MLGIDVSKATLNCTLLHPQTKSKVWEREVPNTPAGIALLLQKTPDSAPWALEPTGRYSQTVVRIAREAGRDVRLAQPKRAKDFLSSIQSRAKTDRLDSKGLALYALAHELPPYPLKTPMAEQLDQLLCARRGLARAIAALEAQRRELPYAAPWLEESISSLKQQRKELDKQIRQVPQTADSQTACAAETIQDSSEVAALSASTSPPAITDRSYVALIEELQRVPGFGPVVASTVVSRLTSRQFSNSDQFVAYAGLDIAIRQSGKSKGCGGITKQGDAEIRRVLYLAAQASLRAKDSPFRAQYEREKAKGLSSTAALCAIARKMARLCWSLVTFGQTYDPDRIYTQPKKRENLPRYKAHQP